MLKANITGMKKKVLFYVSTAMAMLFVIVITASSFVRYYTLQKQEIFFSQQVQFGMNHVLEHYLADYSSILLELVKDEKVIEYIKNKDDKALYLLLAPKWDALQAENKNLQVMQVHLSNGESLLRMHKPKEHGDNLNDFRPMVKAIHTSHKFMHGFETGKYQTAYRIFEPVFDKEGNYIGALEVGLNHQFILEAIADITGFEGIVFVEDKSIPEGYRLDSELTPALHKIYDNTNKTQIMQGTTLVEIEDKRYKTHKIELLDYQGNEKVKIIFFQDISHFNDYRGYVLWLLFGFFALIFAVLIWLIQRRISEYQDEVSAVYDQQISSLKEAENSLLQSKKQFELFMEYIPAKIFIKDQNKNFIYANTLAQKFFNKKELRGLKSEDVFEKEQAEKSNKINNIILEKDFIDTVEEFNDGYGNRVINRIMGFSMEENGVKKIAMVVTDITQSYNDQLKLKEQEEMMIAQSRHAAMGEMISMIAHQWRQPISVISMDANNILADIELESVQTETLKENVGDIISQTQHLSRTIDDFRDFFKPNKLKSEVRIAEVFEDALKIIEKSIENNKIELINNFHSDSVVNIYARELLQVFINILKNAKEALMESPNEEKKITTSIYEEGNFVVVDICDNAGGIDNAIMHAIFDPYFTTKDEKNGTGLGLYMSKIIVEKHLLGELKVINAGTGACFNLKIPKKGEDAQ
jgi:PAS domain S-box-containing protein